jgi:hypothetical protein
MRRLETLKAELRQVDFEETTDGYLPRGDHIRLMGDLME